LANQLNNDKGFLLLKTSSDEIKNLSLVSYGICDSCNCEPKEGVYIAVLNCWYCPDCFERWYTSAERFSEDIKFEEKKFWNVYNALAANCN
jgi:hypothetical protein